MAETFGAVEVARTILSRDDRDDLRCIVDTSYNVFYSNFTHGTSGFCDNQAWDGLYMDSFGHALIAPNEADKYRFGDRKRFFVAIGVNHGEVKNVGFNSLMISAQGEGFEEPDHSCVWNNDGSSGSTSLKGTASSLGSGFDHLFAVGTARDCSGALFTCQTSDEESMAPDVDIVSVDRFYLETDTATGPDMNELLETEFIVFEAP